MGLLKQLKNIFEFAYTKDEPVMEQMSEEEYKQIFLNGRQKEDIETTYKKAWEAKNFEIEHYWKSCLLYTSPSPRDRTRFRMPSSA